MRGKMPTATTAKTRRITRPLFWFSPALTLSLVLATATPLFQGCSLLSKDGGDSGEGNAVEKLLSPPTPPELIRQAAIPEGMNSILVRGVGLVNSLPKTGGPTDPSPYRDQLIEEMRRNNVKSPNEVLELDTNSIVRVTGVIPPGARRGDLLDIQIDAPPGSNATDLHSGWLLDARLRYEQVAGGRVRKGDVLAMATGPMLTRASFQGDLDERNKTQGLILSGGSIQKDRTMGLVLRPEFTHVKVASDIAKAINRRFFFFDGTTRRGVAKPIEDDYIRLELHPRYDEALGRYIAVVRAIAIDMRTANQQSRLQKLATLLLDPTTAADAALQLEALGESAIPTLVEGLKTENAELRFYAAEALAYLDRPEAIEPLEQAIASESAFRHPAFTALKGLDHPEVADALLHLFDHPSIETRYGAYVAMRGRTDAATRLPVEPVGDALRYYEIESTAPPVIVFSTRDTPEVVVFGKPSAIQLTDFLIGPGGLVLKQDPATADKIRISRFQVGEQDQRKIVPSTLRSVVQGIVAVGGNYADVVAVLREAKTKGQLNDPISIDPLPKALRTYYREDESEEE